MRREKVINGDDMNSPVFQTRLQKGTIYVMLAAIVRAIGVIFIVTVLLAGGNSQSSTAPLGRARHRRSYG